MNIDLDRDKSWSPIPWRRQAFFSERVKADLQEKTNQQISDIVKQLGEYKKIDVKKLGLITPQRGMLKAGKRQEAETFIIETFGMGKQRRLTDILELTGLSSTKKWL